MGRAKAKTPQTPDWKRFAALKEAAWLSAKKRLGRAAGLRQAEELRRYAQKLHPDWPGEAQRRRDLDHHIRLSKLFARASASTTR